MNLQQLKIPTDKNSLLFFGGAGFSMLLLLISLIFRLNVAFTPRQEPIKPVNPKPTISSSTKDNTNTTAHSTTSSTQDVIKNSSTTEASTTSKEKEDIKPPAKPDKKNVILTAKEDQSESFEGESIKTYLIDKPIEESGLVTIATAAAVSKMSKESMAEIGFKGEGLVDINLELENQTADAVTIYPENVIFTIDDKEYPINPTADLKNSSLKPEESKSLNLQVVLPKLKNSDALKEVSFTWKTTTNKIDQEYDVLIVLK